MHYYRQQGYQQGDCPYNSDNKYNSMRNQDKKEDCENDKSNNYISGCISLDDLPLAIAYVPWQKWSKTLCAEEGMEHGTIFPELIMPFYGCNYKKVRGSR